MPTDLRDYLNRSGDTELGTGWVEENENGFCVWRVQDGALLLVNVYGNGTYWDAWANDKAKELEVDMIRFMTQRSPKAFEKKFNYKTVGYVLEKEVV